MTWLRWLPATAGLVLLGLCLPPSGAPRAQGTLEQVPFDRKLVASVVADADGTQERFGSALAVSGDTLVVGAPSAIAGGKLWAGAAYVFVRDPASGRWVERKRLVAQDGAAFDEFAGSVAIDGDTIVLGAAHAKVGRVYRQGAAYVFERHAGGPDAWGQVAKLTDDTVGSSSDFGSGIAIQGDLLAVGASSAGRDGQVTLFERDRGGPSAWGKVTAILNSATGDGSGGIFAASFGGAVALDGDLLLVGAASAGSARDGAAYLFRRDGADRDRWNFVARLAADAAGDGRTAHDAFGTAVAIAGDTIAVGAFLAEAVTGHLAGAAYVFRRDPAGADRWDQVAKLIGSDILAYTSPTFYGPSFGRALALAGDTLLVGASGVQIDGPKPRRGAAYRFERHAGGPDAWGEVARLIAADGLTNEAFGAAVALDGRNGIIGASGYERWQGAVYLTGDPPPELPRKPAFPPTGELVNDGIVDGPGGALLGIVGTPLAEPLPVWIVEVPLPAKPLSSMMRPVGAFYSVGAGRTTSTPTDAPFGLALPVPTGTDTAHLGVAILVGGNRALEGVASQFWTTMLGFYNPETALFSFALPTLFIEGSTLVLVEHPDLAPLSEGTAQRSSDTEPTEPRFAVQCYGFADSSECGPDDKMEMNGYLRDAYNDYLRLGFGLPALQTGNYQTSLLVRIGLVKRDRLEYNVAAVNPTHEDYEEECGDRTARYLPETGAIIICYTNQLGKDRLVGALRHEIFHSFQHGSDPFRQAYLNARPINPTSMENFQWISEGTAAAAENSKETMIRVTADKPHPITRALTASDVRVTYNPPPLKPFDKTPEIIAYQAQDFWVFFGKKNDLELGYLKGLFERGASPDVADTFLDQVYHTSLAKEYWAWVKNQAIEKAERFGSEFGNALLGPKCSIDFDRDELVVGKPQKFSYPVDEGSSGVTGSHPLPRLTAEVVKIDIKTTIVGRTTVTAKADITDQPGGILVYKVYLDKDGDGIVEGRDKDDDSIVEGHCGKDDDGERNFEEGELTAGSVVYIVLANIWHEPGSRVGYTVEVKKAEVTPAP